jgi:hypothetical protein
VALGCLPLTFSAWASLYLLASFQPVLRSSLVNTMRLLKINREGTFSLLSFGPRDIPPYAILSLLLSPKPRSLSTGEAE